MDWSRMSRRLMLDRDYQQMPFGNGTPAFYDEHFRFLRRFAESDFRLGRRFTGADAHHVIEVFRSVRNTIRSGPAHFITFPGTDDQVFEYRSGHIQSADTLALDLDVLETVGTLRMPRPASTRKRAIVYRRLSNSKPPPDGSGTGGTGPTRTQSTRRSSSKRPMSHCPCRVLSPRPSMICSSASGAGGFGSARTSKLPNGTWISLL